jgi:hypothetical protein
MSRLLIGLMAVLLSTGPVAAQLDPEMNKPYRLQVVLHIAKHRLLTPVFRQSVERELRDSLQAALGDLARVEIAHTHPLLKEVETAGLQNGLDGYKELFEGKLHFVLIDYVDGAYEIQARQYDGLVGLASPVVRRVSTADRQLVAREAALLMDEDFGIVGTVNVQRLESEKAELFIKGGSLGVPMKHWLNKDDIFALTAVFDRGNAGRRAERIDSVLLQAVAEPKDGVCACRVLHRYKFPPLMRARPQGFRAIRQGTTDVAHLRLRLVTADLQEMPVAALGVSISQQGFDAKPDEQLSSGPDGWVRSRLGYKNVAFVKVVSGSVELARAPVEIVSDRPIKIPIDTNAERAKLAPLYMQRDRWTQHVFDVVLVAAAVINSLNAEQSNEKAKEKTEAALKLLHSDTANLTEERETLARQANEQAKGRAFSLAEGDRGMERLKQVQAELEEHLGQLNGAIIKEKDPKRQAWNEMANKAGILVREAEYQQAIDLYEQILAQGGDDPSVEPVRKLLEPIKKAWEIKSPEHRQARAFIYEVWPKEATAAEMKNNMPKARAAFETCRNAGDVLTPQKLARVNNAHGLKLRKELDSLTNRDRNDDDRRAAETIAAVTKDLEDMNKEIKNYLEKAAASQK